MRIRNSNDDSHELRQHNLYIKKDLIYHLYKKEMAKKNKKNPLNWTIDTVDTRSTCAKCENKLPNNSSVKLQKLFIHS